MQPSSRVAPATTHCTTTSTSPARCSSDRVDETHQLLVGVVVVHRRAVDRRQPTRLEVVAREVDGRHRDVDGLRAQRRGELVHVDAVDGEGDDAALLDTAVVQRQSRYCGELLAE